MVCYASKKKKDSSYNNDRCSYNEHLFFLQYILATLPLCHQNLDMSQVINKNNLNIQEL